MCVSFFLLLCSHCLVFCGSDTLVCFEVFSFFVLCYVMINLPLGTWRPRVPQRIWRTLCAIPACLDFLSHIQNGHLYSYPILATELVSQLCFFFFLLPGYYLEDRSHQITTNRNQLAVANKPKVFPSFFIASFQWDKAGVNPTGCIHDLNVIKSVCACKYRKKDSV